MFKTTEILDDITINENFSSFSFEFAVDPRQSNGNAGLLYVTTKVNHNNV